MPFIRSISGLRATLTDSSLNENLVSDYAKAFAKYLPLGEVVLGRDGRPSGVWIEAALAEALAAQGRNVRILGVVPTPTVQLEVEKSSAAGGIAITASHNPTDWNGMKFINSRGVFLDAKENQDYWAMLEKESATKCSTDSPFQNDNNFHKAELGSIYFDSEAINKHIKIIGEIPFIKNNLDAIRSLKFKVVVDAVNASGSIAVPNLLRYFGCQVIELYCDESGEFPHEPEPLPRNLTKLADAVKSYGCDLGIAVDPDADRLVLADALGRCVNEEMTLVLAVDSLLSHSNSKNPIVINLSSSKLSEVIAKKYDVQTFRSAVGEINVVKKMEAVEAQIGGEGSGGVILPECHSGRDSLVGIALVLLLLSTQKKPLHEIIANYPKFFMIKHKQPFLGDFSELKEKLRNNFTGAAIGETDGIRFDYDSFWLQARASNTEPIIRIIAEAPTQKEAQNLIDKAIKSIQG